MIIQSNSTFTIQDITSTYDKLPVGVYILKYSDKMGYFLSKTQDFVLPSKIYGSTRIVDKVINTFNTRPNKNLGVLFEGIKGSSKTLLSKLICTKINLPVILIQETFEDLESEVISFLSNPQLGDCVVFFDEFEKIFPSRCQTPILTLLDGTVNTHHLYLFTSNSKDYRDEFLNRPSRIYYRLVFDKIDDSVKEEVIEDLLVNKSQKAELTEVLDRFLILNFDILMSIIEEMNRYNCSAKEVVSDFGFNHEQIMVKTTCIPAGESIEYEANDDWYWTMGTSLGVHCPIPGKSMVEDYRYLSLSPESIKRVGDHYEAIDSAGNRYIIRRNNPLTLLF